MNAYHWNTFVNCEYSLFLEVVKDGSQSIQAALASVLTRRSRVTAPDDAVSDEDSSDDDWGSDDDDDEFGGGGGGGSRYYGMQWFCSYLPVMCYATARLTKDVKEEKKLKETEKVREEKERREVIKEEVKQRCEEAKQALMEKMKQKAEEEQRKRREFLKIRQLFLLQNVSRF